MLMIMYVLCNACARTMCIKVTNNTSPISSWTLLRETAGPRALWKEIDVIEKMLERCDRLDDCYWICAFCGLTKTPISPLDESGG